MFKAGATRVFHLCFSQKRLLGCSSSVCRHELCTARRVALRSNMFFHRKSKPFLGAQRNQLRSYTVRRFSSFLTASKALTDYRYIQVLWGCLKIPILGVSTATWLRPEVSPAHLNHPWRSGAGGEVCCWLCARPT